MTKVIVSPRLMYYFYSIIKSNTMTKPVRYKTVEEVINEKRAAEAEELRQLRNLKRNLESGIVMDISKHLMKILLTYETKDL